MNIPKGREDIARLFENCIQNDRLAQAYIFHAPKGMGKKTVLKYVLSLLVCSSKTSCGNCLSCNSFEIGTHPDVVELKRDEDKASLGVGKVRDIKTEVYTRPVMSDYKAVVVHEAHLATAEAQNAMLKMIEEPPEKVVFFFLCDTLAPILSTVISRSVVVNLKPLPTDVIKEISGADDFAVSICEGNIGKLKELTSDTQYATLRDEVTDAFSLIASSDPYAPYEAASRLDKIKDGKDEILNIMLTFARDAYYKKQNLNAQIINKDKMNYIEKFASMTTQDGLWRIMNHIITAQKEKGKNGNFNIAVTILLLRCLRELNNRK